MTQLALGKNAQAESALLKAAEMGQRLPEVHRALGDLYVANRKYVEAAANYRMAIQMRQNYTEAHIGLGRSLEAVGQLRDAEESFLNALAYDADNPVILYRLGQIFAQTGDLGRAESYLELAIDQAGADVDLLQAIKKTLESLREGS